MKLHDGHTPTSAAHQVALTALYNAWHDDALLGQYASVRAKKTRRALRQAVARLHNRLLAMSSNPFYVALYGGFLVVEDYPAPAERGGTIRKCYTVADARIATPYDTFELADATAKWAANFLYPPDLRYFAILQPVFD